MKTKGCALLLIIFMVVMASASHAETLKPKFISIGTAPTGASFYPMGVAMAKIIKDYVPGIKASAVPTGASKENINLIIKEEAQLGFVTSPAGYEALNSVGDYKGLPAAPIRVICAGHFGPWTLVARKDSGIKTYADVKGKRIIANMPRADANLKAFLSVTRHYGIAESDMNIMKLMSIKNTIQQVKDGRADAVFYIVTPGSAVFVDLTRSIETSWPSIPDDIITKIIQEKPYYSPFTFKPDMFKGQENAVKAIGSTITVCTHKDMDPDLVYAIVKAFYEHTDILENAHPIGKQYTLKRAVSFRAMPFHEGAIKYYKEMGVW